MTRRFGFRELVRTRCASRRIAEGREGRPVEGPQAAEVPKDTQDSPPLNASAKVDWLTMTWLPEADEYVPGLVRDLLASVLGQVQGVDCPGMFGYDHGVRFFLALDDGQQHHVARLDFGGNQYKGRARLDLSGSACSKVSSWRAVQAWIGQQFDHVLTRVDLAVDCLHGEFSVDDAADWYLAGDFNAGGRMPKHSTPGDWLLPQSGRTLEVGRRVNGKMLRAYEKGRQLGDKESPWVRFEVELRNKDRDLPLDILTNCDEYFTGAYKCLQRVLDAMPKAIPTHQAEGEITIRKLVGHARDAYGRLVNVLRVEMDADQVLDFLSRPGVPKRLEKASLAGFKAADSPSAFLQMENES